MDLVISISIDMLWTISGLLVVSILYTCTSDEYSIRFKRCLNKETEIN